MDDNELDITKLKYVLYARKSTDDPQRQLRSIPDQILECKQLADRLHLNVVAVLEETKSAKKPNRRPIFKQMLIDLKNGTYDGILAWHPDRLARNSIDGRKIIYLLDDKKLLDLKFPQFWFESTPQGKFMLNIAFGQSKYYVDNLSENVKRGLRQKIRTGVWPGKATYGYVNNSKTRGVDPDIERLKAIKKGFELFSEGNKTFTDIASYLYKFGLKRKIDKPLHINQIRQILSDRFYIGIMYYNGEYHEGNHKTIVSKELFQKVQQELRFRDRHKKEDTILHLWV